MVAEIEEDQPERSSNEGVLSPEGACISGLEDNRRYGNGRQHTGNAGWRNRR
jgi:hypothetical protein